MSDRKLRVKPPRRPDVSGFDAAPVEQNTATDGSEHRQSEAPVASLDEQPKPTPRRRKKAKPSPGTGAGKGSDRRRRVHVTLARTTADAVRARVAATGSSNSQVFIEAHGAVAASVTAPAPPTGPFAPRRPARSDVPRVGVYFYFSDRELAHLDDEAQGAGFDTRSAHFDAILAKHLL